jgi:pimeloyl-ACP methyl ester carboxylesterase
MPAVNVKGVDIHYEVHGKGEPLLLLPGLGTNRTYYGAAEPILRKSFQTILVDPRGLGASKDPNADFLAESMAPDYAALLDHLGVGSAHVVGSSHGGCMAMALADQFPDKIRSLILIGAFSELDRALAMNFQLRIKIVQKCGLGEEICDHIALWIFRRQFLEGERGAKALQSILTAIKSNTPEQYIALCRSILHWGRKLPGQENEKVFTEKLPSLRCPTLVISGDSDHMIPASFSKLVAYRIPNATYSEISDCGHIPVLEQPEVVCGIISDYVHSPRAGMAAAAAR